jgi:serine/threonine-protein phosphatase 2A regulatory subunit B''
MYKADAKLDGKLSFREYKKAKITKSLFDIEAETDINKNRDFLSYEDFYVIYIKFWELDTDHDFFLTKEEFSKYSGYTLSRKVV